MKILVIGASGMIGSRIMREALGREHAVVAAARNPGRITEVGVDKLSLDVNDSAAVAAVAEHVDVVVSAVAPRASGDPTKDALAFTRSLIEVHRETGKRIVMVGGGGTLHLPDGTPVAPLVPEPYSEEAKAMRRAYGLLVAEDIDFVVLAPSGTIAPGERTGTFRLGGRVVIAGEDGEGRISAEDFAVALLDEIEQPKHFRTVFTVGY